MLPLKHYWTLQVNQLVNPGGKYVLENATVSGILTVDADGSNSATLDFSTATGNVDFAYWYT